jgi:hypothetical protein
MTDLEQKVKDPEKRVFDLENWQGALLGCIENAMEVLQNEEYGETHRIVVAQMYLNEYCVD